MSMQMIAPLEVGLSVRDLARMRDFYENVMGCQFVSEVAVPAAKASEAALCDEAYTVVRLQTSYGERIKLLATQTPAPVQAHEGPILAQPQAAYLTFIVADIRAAIARLLAAGAEMLTGPERIEVRPGTYLVFCKDPEGHVLEIVEYEDIAGYRKDLNHRSA